jgi:hypothetical protein
VRGTARARRQRRAARPAPPGPGPGDAIGRRALSRPRVASLLVFAALIAIGVACIARGSAAGIVIGALVFVLPGAFCLAATLRQRVWVEGTLLTYRTLRTRSVRLDHLRRASLGGWGRNKGPQLELADTDGGSVLIDATNNRLTSLYELLAQYLPRDSPIPDERLRKKLRPFWPPSPFGDDG